MRRGNYVVLIDCLDDRLRYGPPRAMVLYGNFTDIRLAVKIPRWAAATVCRARGRHLTADRPERCQRCSSNIARR